MTKHSTGFFFFSLLRYLRPPLLVLSIILVQSFYLAAEDSTSHLRISIITCGPGDELYAGFGHSAVRIFDSLSQQDIAYNYGTFNFSDPDFYSKFTRGKLLYYVNPESFQNFLYGYEYEKRYVYEQVLNMGQADLKKIKSYLENNAKEENKYYSYDFLFDNCSTRIRDIFEQIFGKDFQFPGVIQKDSISFRDEINHYLRNNHWTRFGINLLLGSKVDQKMNSRNVMFLPDFLMNGFEHAQYKGEKVISQTIRILPGISRDQQQTRNPIKLLFWAILILYIALSVGRSASGRMVYWDTFLFLLIGLLGCFMLFMWFGTNHQSCALNRNILWALPTHVLFAFLIPKNTIIKHQYARIAFWILLISLFWNLFAIQKFMPELFPLLLLLLFRLNHYRHPVKMIPYGNKTFRK